MILLALLRLYHFVFDWLWVRAWRDTSGSLEMFRPSAASLASMSRSSAAASSPRCSAAG
jgi:hypothetical protein